MSSKTYESKHALTNFLHDTVPDLEATLIIDKDGTILEYKFSEEFKKNHNMLWVRNIAKKVSIRFKIKNFHKELEGLHMTINIFKRHILLVRSLSNNIIIVMILGANTDIRNSLDVVLDIKNRYSNQSGVS